MEEGSCDGSATGSLRAPSATEVKSGWLEDLPSDVGEIREGFRADDDSEVGREPPRLPAMPKCSSTACATSVCKELTVGGLGYAAPMDDFWDILGAVASASEAALPWDPTDAITGDESWRCDSTRAPEQTHKHSTHPASPRYLMFPLAWRAYSTSPLWGQTRTHSTPSTMTWAAIEE